MNANADCDAKIEEEKVAIDVEQRFGAAGEKSESAEVGVRVEPKNAEQRIEETENTKREV